MTGYFPYASGIEIAQLVLAAVGVGVAFWRLWVAAQNGLAVVRDDRTDLRLFVADSAIFDELIRMFKHGLLLFAGVVSILLPPPNPYVDVQEQLQGFLLRMALILLTCAMVFNSVMQEYRRRQFIDKAREFDRTATPGEARSIKVGTSVGKITVNPTEQP